VLQSGVGLSPVGLLDGMKERSIITWAVLFVLLVCFSGCDPGASRNFFCVRAGAIGTGDGSDWDNAFPTLPARLKRGATYFIAAGTYPSYRFAERPKGTKRIVVRKATAADHGTDVGWAAAFGDGPVIWRGPLYVDTSYWELDGRERNEDDWFDGAAYGFRIHHNEAEQQLRLGELGRAVSGVEIRNVYFEARVGGLSSTTTGRRYGLDIDTAGGVGTFHGLIVSRCFFQHGNVPIFTRNNEGMIVEYSAFDANESNPANHGEAVSAFYSNHRLIIRYNKFRAITGTAVIAFTSGGAYPVNGFEIYGNVIWDCQLGDGVFGFDREEWPFVGTKIYNNTIARKSAGANHGIAIRSGTNNQVHNNLWIDCEQGFWNGAGAEYSHNAYSWEVVEPEAQARVPTSIFRDYEGNDFRLRAPTAGGVRLESPFDHDLTGKVRGVDGDWDRGAFEF
jgi:hypothetical protein